MSDVPHIRYERVYFWSLPLGVVFGTILIGALIAFAALRGSAAAVATQQNAALIDSFERTKEKADTSMIMLGNSRLRHAIAVGFDPSVPVVLPNGRTAAMLQFAENAAIFNQYAVLTDRIIQAKPDSIVIVDALLSNGRYPLGRPVLAAKAVYDSVAQALFGGSEIARWERQRHDIITDCITEFSASETKARLEMTAFRDAHELNVQSNPNVVAAQAFVSKALAAGIKVIVLHIPSNPAAESEAHIPAIVLDVYPLKAVPTPEQLLPESSERVQWVSASPTLSRGDYCDFVHLNEKGRALYTDWFLQHVVGY